MIAVIMETFEQIWESSRTNSLSWMYPMAVVCGSGVLIVACVITNPWARRLAKLGAIVGFSVLATEFSAREIHEKWRLRREWAELHPSQMTEDGYKALTVDGANRTVEPLMDGFKALSLLVCIAVALTVSRAWIATRRRNATGGMT